MEPAATPTRPLPTTPAGPGQGGRKRWLLRASELHGRLGHSGLPPLVARILENRGVGSSAEAQIFLGGKPQATADPFHLPGFEPAIARLRAAIEGGDLVAVYGDFDVDGITSTAILTEALRDLGGNVLPYIPHREREGYGLNLRAIESLADRGVNVLVTCDCGTSSLPEVDHARSLGLEVIVVDHHLPPPTLPAATALVNPKLAVDGAAYGDFASAGLAYRLAEALYGAGRRPFPAERYLPLAALATVADMVPLRGENRALVQDGLAALATTTRPGLRALMQVAGVKPKEATAESIAFSLAPRLNAAGRLADARLALDLLLCDDEATALALATEIDGLNRERQSMTQAAQQLARELVEDRGDRPLLLVGHEGFHQGIIGLVASRLVESHGRPAVVYQRGEGESRASCRSIRAYDIVGGLRSCGELFERYGGHRAAAGFTIRNDRLEALEERLLEHAAAELADVDLSPTLDIDAEWQLGALRSQEIRWLAKLQPHGVGNEDAVLLSHGASVAEARTVGDGRHLRMKLRDGASIWPAIAFDWGAEAPAEGSRIDVAFSLSKDRYGASEGGGALQLRVLDLAPSA